MDAVSHTLGASPCIDFVNSRFSDHTGTGKVIDSLGTPKWQLRFLERWRLGPVHGPPNVGQLRDARQTLRRALEAWAAGRPLRRSDLRRLDAWMAAAPLLRRFGGQVEPVRRDWSWVLAEVVASAARLVESGEARRLKTCANPGCTWLFVDESRNLSRRWCDPAICGNLIAVRQFRRRHRATAATT